MAGHPTAPRPSSTGPGPPRWVAVGLLVGGILAIFGAAAAESPALGVSTTWGEVLLFAGSALALLVVVGYLLVAPAPVAAPRSLPRATAPPPRPPSRRAIAAPAPAPTVLLPPPTPSPSAAAQLSASNAVRRAAAVGILGSPVASTPVTPGPAPAPAPEAVPPPAPSHPPDGLTSIPGAYLEVGGGRADDVPIWSEVAPPVAAALPFSAGVARLPSAPSESEPPVSHPIAAALEQEVERLRARVRELEVRRPPVLSGARTRPSVPSPIAATTQAPEPPSPPAQVTLAPRGCYGCGGALEANRPPPLCWGCGRALCHSCYWHYGPGPGLHRCPECLSKAPGPSTGISGGRGARPTSVGAAPPRSGTPTSPPGAR